MHKRAPRVEDTIQIFKGAWTGQPFSYDGYVLSVDDVNVRPTPAQQGVSYINLGGT